MTILGVGKGLKVTQLDIWEIAQSINTDPAIIDGIGITESNQSGWFSNGQLKILPEPHKFYKYLPKIKKMDALKNGLATRTYQESKDTGHYKRMTNGPGPSYALLQKWIDFDETAAYMAISSGSFQIMGFNFEACGFTDAKAMFNAFCDSESVQLKAFVNFIKSLPGGLDALRKADYSYIEEHYNGGGQNGVYAGLMKENVDKARKGRWLNWHPSNIADSQVIPKTAKSLLEIKAGDINKDVEAIQNRLIIWGANIKADGQFGAATTKAVKDFQSFQNLKSTGIIDTLTRLALYTSPNPKEKLKIERDIKPIIIQETKQTQIPVVPAQAKKPFWKSWSVGGIATIISGWFTSLIGDLEPWMKFTLILIGIVIALLMVWQRQRLFNEAKAIINNVQDFNNSNASTTIETLKPSDS